MSTGAFIVFVLGVITVAVIASVLGIGVRTNPEVTREKHVLVARSTRMRRVFSLFAHCGAGMVDAS